MVSISRRRLLALLGGSAATAAGGRVGAQEGGEPEGDVQEVVSIPGELVPENLAFDGNGDLYFGITAGQVRRLPASETGETGLRLEDTQRVATLPGSVIGVETDPEGTVYAAVVREQGESGVFQVPPDGDPSRLATIRGFPNGVLLDRERERLLVAESNDGVVYEVALDGGATAWLDAPRLDTAGFGANGLAPGPDGGVLVTVTQAPNETGRLLRVPVADDGSALAPDVYFEGPALYGADGVDTLGGQPYVAVNRQNRVVRVTPGERVITVASADDGLVFPSDVAFDPTSDGNLFICNFANPRPEEAGILRMRV